MTTLLLATLYAVKFGGGTPNDFVTALADATQQNVVMTQGDAKNLSPSEFETTDIDTMARAIRAQMKHMILPGTDLVLGDQLLSKQMVSEARQIRLSGLEFNTVEGGRIAADVEVSRRAASGAMPPTEALLSVNRIGMPATAVKDGKITFKTEKADALQLPMLTGILSKPVKVHWIYSEAPVFVNVKDMPEMEFLKWSAKAIGARLTSSAKEYSFELDPVEIRKRAVLTIQAQPVPQGGRGDSRNEVNSRQQAKNFRISIINALTPAQISAALAETGSSTQIELNARSPLTRIAVQRVQQLDAERQNRPQQGPPGQAQPGVMQRVDSSRMAILTVDSRFGIQMEIPVLDQNGRPGGVVRL